MPGASHHGAFNQSPVVGHPAHFAVCSCILIRPGRCAWPGSFPEDQFFTVAFWSESLAMFLRFLLGPPESLSQFILPVAGAPFLHMVLVFSFTLNILSNPSRLGTTRLS